MTQIPYPYDDRIKPHPYNSIVPEAENMRYVRPTHPRLLRPTTPHFEIAHTHDHFQLSPPSSMSHYSELNPPPRVTHSSYSLLLPENEPSGGTPTDCGSLWFSKPLRIYNPWGPFYPSSSLLPSATYDISPSALRFPTLDLTLCPDFPGHQSAWPTGSIPVSAVDELPPAPSNYYPPSFSLHNAGPSPVLHLDHNSEQYSKTLDTSASYPCQWMENGATCNVIVQVTRGHMNRHLHTCHGFGGSDTRQAKCCWAGCGEMMQQGSIARHMVTCHLQAKVTCPMCSKKLSRQDVISKHQRVCPVASTRR